MQSMLNFFTLTCEVVAADVQTAQSQQAAVVPVGQSACQLVVGERDVVDAVQAAQRVVAPRLGDRACSFVRETKLTIC